MSTLPLTDRTRLTRARQRQVTDRSALHALLDAALVAHVGIVRDGWAVVLPMACARRDDELLLHGSTGSGLLRAAAAGVPLTATVTLLDGVVYARTVVDTSMNYRSAMVVGTARVVEGAEAVDALRVLSEHLMPGRWDEVREPTARELAATAVLALPLAEASVKIRSGDPSSTPDDGEDRAVWAGVLPLRTTAGAPVAAADVPSGVAVPASVRGRAASL